MPEERWVSTDAGRHLSGRKKRDTGPEVALRKALHAEGARFRLQRQLAKGCTPDIVMPGRMVAVFVDGCFWHSCPEHGRKTPFAGPNADLWQQKMRRNIERDLRSTELAKTLGWRVHRFWECQVREDAGGIARELLSRCQSGI